MLHLIPPQGSLPPERELAKMLGVGRATVQQAIRLLQQEGLLTRRRGRSGGTFVLGPSSAEESLEALLPKIRRDVDDIEQALAFRSAIEPVAAALAAGARTERDLEALARVHEAEVVKQLATEILALDTEYHLIVARMTKNRFLVEGVEAVRVVLGDALVALPETPRWRRRSDREHAAILAAIQARDAAAAERAMRHHVLHTEAAVRALMRAL